MKPLIDLTMPIHEGMTTYPGHPHTEIEMVKRYQADGREVRKFSMSTHAGTHIDAPRHFIPNGLTIDQIHPDILIGKCAVVDFFDLAMGNINLPDERRILLRSGWYHMINDKVYYEHGGLGKRALEQIMAIRPFLIAMDFPSPDAPGQSKVHNILLGYGAVLVEYLTNTDALADIDEVEIYCLPLKIVGADGAPCRVLARPL